MSNVLFYECLYHLIETVSNILSVDRASYIVVLPLDILQLCLRESYYFSEYIPLANKPCRKNLSMKYVESGKMHVL